METLLDGRSTQRSGYGSPRIIILASVPEDAGLGFEDSASVEDDCPAAGGYGVGRRRLTLILATLSAARRFQRAASNRIPEASQW